jgi:hypothetical protein
MADQEHAQDADREVRGPRTARLLPRMIIALDAARLPPPPAGEGWGEGDSVRIGLGEVLCNDGAKRTQPLTLSLSRDRRRGEAPYHRARCCAT